MPPDIWISVLEGTAYAPWLYLLNPSPDLSERLRRGHSLIHQIVFYLTRPGTGRTQTQTNKFLDDFRTAPASPGSEMARARKATEEMIRAVVFHIGSIPEDHELRKKQEDIFALFGMVKHRHDIFLSSKEGKEKVALIEEDWKYFWPLTEPFLLILMKTLDDKGFGFKKRGDPEAD